MGMQNFFSFHMIIMIEIAILYNQSHSVRLEEYRIQKRQVKNTSYLISASLPDPCRACHLFL